MPLPFSSLRANLIAAFVAVIAVSLLLASGTFAYLLREYQVERESSRLEDIAAMPTGPRPSTLTWSRCLWPRRLVSSHCGSASNDRVARDRGAALVRHVHRRLKTWLRRRSRCCRGAT